MTEATGEVYDIGYQHYEGPREGRMRARKALWINGVRTSLGLGRSAWAKLLPLAMFFAALLLAVIFSIIATVADDLPDAAELPGHADYYQIVSIILLLFSAIVAPELLCPDRRDNVIHLYFVRSLTATDYVAARWLAFFSITLALVYSGQVVLLIGLVMAAAEPVEYLRENWLDVPRFLGAGLAVAMFTTTIPMAVAAFTNRWAYAAAAVIGLFMISSAVAGSLAGCDEEREVRPGVVAQVECEPPTGDQAKWYTLIGIVQAPIYISDLTFAKENEGLGLQVLAELPRIVPISWYLLLVAGPGFALWWRYQRIQV